MGKDFFFANSPDKKLFILGAIEQQSRLYLFGRNNHIHSLYVPFDLFKNVYKFVIGQSKAEPEVPEVFKNRVAKCYHAFGLVKEAYKLTLSQEHKFDLALALGYTRDGNFEII